ncbi:hypothetical protein H5410_004187, partial [Solanum commersonii]
GVFEGIRIAHVTRIMDLPMVITIEIFSRFSIKSIFYCTIIFILRYYLLTLDHLFVDIDAVLIPRGHLPTPTLSKQNMILIAQMEEKNSHISQARLTSRLISWRSTFYVTFTDSNSSEFVKGVFEGIRIAHVTRIMDLPMVIMIKKVSQLSIKSTFCCMIIFILQYYLLTFDPLFVDMYHKRSFNFPKIFHSINYYV